MTFAVVLRVLAAFAVVEAPLLPAETFFFAASVTALEADLTTRLTDAVAFPAAFTVSCAALFAAVAAFATGAFSGFGAAAAGGFLALRPPALLPPAVVGLSRSCFFGIRLDTPHQAYTTKELVSA
jgi:hypothetical protein